MCKQRPHAETKIDRLIDAIDRLHAALMATAEQQADTSLRLQKGCSREDGESSEVC